MSSSVVINKPSIKQACMNVFKLSICTKSAKMSPDYEPCAYGKNSAPTSIKKPRAVKSEVQPPAVAYNDTQSLCSNSCDSDYADCSSSVQNLDNINISKWHSTKLGDDGFDQTMPYFSVNYAAMGNSKKLSSTIQEQANMLIKKGYYDNSCIEEPVNYTVISHKPSYLNLPSQVENTTYDSYETYSSNDDGEFTPQSFYTTYDSYTTSTDYSEENTTVFPSSLVTASVNSSDNCEDLSSCESTKDYFDEIDAVYSSDYYVCILDYKPKFEGDLCIKYSEKVKVVSGSAGAQSANKNYVLVQLLKSGKYGYVPRKCLISLAQYLSL